MSQNISSRKQELLSRLKTTLAIVSQATGFDRSDDVNKPRELPQWASQRDPRLNRRQEGVSEERPDTGPGHGQSSCDYLGGPSSQVAPSLSDVSGSTTVTSVFDKIEDFDDEDEFLYGSKDSSSSQPLASNKKESVSHEVNVTQQPNDQWTDSVQVSSDAQWNRGVDVSRGSGHGGDDRQWIERRQMRDDMPAYSSRHESNEQRWTSGGIDAARHPPSAVHWSGSGSVQSERQWTPSSQASGNKSVDERLWSGSASVQQPPHVQPRADVSAEPTESVTAKAPGLNSDVLQSILKLITANQPAQSLQAAGMGTPGVSSTQNQQLPVTLNDNRLSANQSHQASIVYQSAPTMNQPQPSYNQGHQVFNQMMPGYNQPADSSHFMYNQMGNPMGHPSSHMASRYNQAAPSFNQSASHLSQVVNQTMSGPMTMGFNQSAGHLGPAFEQSSPNLQAYSRPGGQMSDFGQSLSRGLSSDSSFIDQSLSQGQKPVGDVRLSNPSNNVIQNLVGSLLSASSNTTVQPSRVQPPPEVKSTTVPTAAVAHTETKTATSENQNVDELKGTLDKLLNMMGCNDNVVQLMQELMRKDEQTKKVQGETEKENATFSAKPQVKQQEEPDAKQGSAAVEKVDFVKEDEKQQVVQPTTLVEDKVTEIVEPKQAVQQDIPVSSTLTIPVLSSLSRLQKNYDSGDESDKEKDGAKSTVRKTGEKPLPRSTTRPTTRFQPVTGKDAEWEKSTEEFLRSLQAKPKPKSRERSLSPRRSSSPKKLRPKSPERREDSMKKSSVDGKTGDVGKRDRKTPNKEVAKLTEQSEEKSGPPLTEDDKSQLVKAREEIVSTVDLLQHELENLKATKNTLLLAAADSRRTEELQRNILMQNEIEDHISSLKKALTDINNQLNRTVAAPTQPVQEVDKKASSSTTQGPKHRSASSSSSSSSSTSSRSRSGHSGSSSRSGSRHRHRRSRSRSRGRGRQRGGQWSGGRYADRDSRQTRRDEQMSERHKMSSTKKQDAKRSDEVGKKNVDAKLRSYETGISAVADGRTDARRVDNSMAPGSGSGMIISALAGNVPGNTFAGAAQLSAATTAFGIPVSMPHAVGPPASVATIFPIRGVTPGMVAPAGGIQSSAAPGLIGVQPTDTTSVSDRDGSSSTFSRENIVRSLQEMVKPAIDSLDGSTIKEEVELNEKQRSALEFAISMYMAANEFYDGGSLWCRLCDNIFSDTSGLCRHLHSDHHQLKLDPDYNKPKISSTPKKPTCADGSLVAPARGDEFLMPLQAFFCSLCCEFSKDSASAEAHIKSRDHNNKFKNFLKDNPSYEMQYLRGKMIAVTTTAQKELERQKMLLQQSNDEKPKDEAAPKVELQKRKLNELSQEAEVKRVKVANTDEETKRISVGMDKDTKQGPTLLKQTVGKKDNTEEKRVVTSIKTPDVKQEVAGESRSVTSSSRMKEEPQSKKPPSPDRNRRGRDRSPDRSKKRRSRERSPDTDRDRRYTGSDRDRYTWRSDYQKKFSLTRKDDRKDPKRSSDKDSVIIVSPPKTGTVGESPSKLSPAVKTGVSTTSSAGAVSKTSAAISATTTTTTSSASSNFRFSWTQKAKLPVKKPSGNTEKDSGAANPLKFNMGDFEVLDECDAA